MSTSDDWGGWEQDRRRKLVAGMDVSVDDRLTWLEEMLELAWARGALPKARDEWGRPLPAPPGE